MTGAPATPIIRMLVCGQAERGDDGVALAAAATLLPGLAPHLTPHLEVHRCPELATDDLIDPRDDVRFLLLDTVTGPAPGQIIRVSLRGLHATAPFHLRSSHELPVDLLVGLAEVIRKRPIEGTIVAVGGHRFGFGTPLSRSARAALPAYRSAITEELELLACPATAAGPSVCDAGLEAPTLAPAR